MVDSDLLVQKPTWNVDLIVAKEKISQSCSKVDDIDGSCLSELLFQTFPRDNSLLSLAHTKFMMHLF